MVERRRRKVGEILISQGLVTHEQLQHGLEEHKQSGVSLGTVLIGLGYISEDELGGVLGQQIKLSQKKRIGEVLLDQGMVNEEQLQEALLEQEKTGMQLGKCLANLGYISELEVIDALSAQLDVQHVVLDYFSFNRELLAKVPEDMARQYRVIPLFEKDGAVTIAMAEPTNQRTMNYLKFKIGKAVEPVIATERSIISAIDKNYVPGFEQISELLNASKIEELDVITEEEVEIEPLTVSEGAQVIQLVNLIISQAVTEGASDIHIEPMNQYLRLRYRIDGELVEKQQIPLNLHAQIVSRLKIMAGMDIAEKRRPQDGHFQVRHQGRAIDLRVSTFPSMTRSRGIFEKTVMRIIDQEVGGLELDQIGLLPKTFELFDWIIKRSGGIILVVGPTGSGKSSTLFAALQRLGFHYGDKKNIVTMEDPVEFILPGITQGQINVKAGFGFADGVRSILRQDPDIIMVGEMRDRETCEMAIQAALTGHLVLSTLHTNDAASTYTRLIDMGIEPFLIASTVIGILAQRLVPKICSRCKESYEPDPELLKKLGFEPGTTMYQGRGCKACDKSGYKGRLGLFEFLIPDRHVQELVLRRTAGSEIKEYCMENTGFITLRSDGLSKVLEGHTTIEQVIGATQGE